METKIRITGQPMGNFKLRSACITDELVEEKKFFNDIVLIYPTKKHAVKALSEAYQYLRSDKEDWDNSSATYHRGVSITYDASRAYIEEN